MLDRYIHRYLFANICGRVCYFVCVNLIITNIFYIQNGHRSVTKWKLHHLCMYTRIAFGVTRNLEVLIGSWCDTMPYSGVLRPVWPHLSPRVRHASPRQTTPGFPVSWPYFLALPPLVTPLVTWRQMLRQIRGLAECQLVKYMCSTWYGSLLSLAKFEKNSNL